MKRFRVSDLSILEVATELENGAIVLYPTDTLPGIGCLGSNKKAIDKLFAIKKRDPSKPVSYAFSSFEMMSRYVELTPNAMKLKPLLPGKLTLILPKRSDGDTLYGVESQNLGCRIPNVNWLLELISYLNAPIVTTSANISGTHAVNRTDQIPKDLLEQIDVVIEWPGELLGVGSTVIDLSMKDDFKILRKGAISEAHIESMILH